MLNDYEKDNGKSAFKEEENRVKGLSDDFQKKIKQGQEQLGKIAASADKQVRENPWPILAGVALISFFLGSVISSAKSK